MRTSPRVEGILLLLFLGNHGLHVMDSIHFILHVRLHVPEMGKDYVLEGLGALESHRPRALGLNPGSASY